MVKIWGFLPVRNENVPHISTESLPRNVQNNTGNFIIAPFFPKEIPWWLEKINLPKGLGYSNSEVIGGLARFIKGVQGQN